MIWTSVPAAVSNSGNVFSNCLTIAVESSLSPLSDVASSSAVVFTEYQLDCLDLYLVELGPRIVNRRNRTLIPIVRERDALVSTLTKLYDQIGLDPRRHPFPRSPSTCRRQQKCSVTSEYYWSTFWSKPVRGLVRVSRFNHMAALVRVHLGGVWVATVAWGPTNFLSAYWTQRLHTAAWRIPRNGCLYRPAEREDAHRRDDSWIWSHSSGWKRRHKSLRCVHNWRTVMRSRTRNGF